VMAGIESIGSQKWSIDQRHWVPVTVIVANNIYIGQTNAETGDTDQIILSIDGAQALVDLLMDEMP
jgi:hypothetical protein